MTIDRHLKFFNIMKIHFIVSLAFAWSFWAPDATSQITEFEPDRQSELIAQADS